MIVLRSDSEVPDEIREKIALFTDVDVDAVDPRRRRPRPSTRSRSSSRRSASAGCSSASSASATPRRCPTSPAGARWSTGSRRPRPTLEIALVGKYIELPDAYLSVTEALKHAAWAHGVDAKVRWVDSEALTTENVRRAARRRCGRSSSRAASATAGIEGKVLAAHFARDHGSRTSACASACSAR